MAWLRKKSDPISDRARILSDEIAALEAQIKSLDGRLQQQPAGPRLRSTALPLSSAPPSLDGPSQTPLKPVREPIFEEVDLDRLQSQGDSSHTPAHFNELGVRKYDLPALFSRIRNHFRGPSASNPKLVSYLAAGGIQGLRPLRYEKRVARNRFIVFVIFLFVMLLGLVAAFFRRL
jgi:hypothetical protein